MLFKTCDEGHDVVLSHIVSVEKIKVNTVPKPPVPVDLSMQYENWRERERAYIRYNTQKKIYQDTLLPKWRKENKIVIKYRAHLTNGSTAIFDKHPLLGERDGLR